MREEVEKREFPLLNDWLKNELPKQYKERAKRLNEMGFLTPLESNEMGILGVDGTEYPLPTIDNLRGEIEANPEFYELKLKQGFSEIEIVPFGLPRENFLENLRKELLKKIGERGNFEVAKNKNEGDYYPSLTLDKETPISLREGGFPEENIVFYPEKFESDHGGLTKEEVLKRSSFGGFNVFLREGDPVYFYMNQFREKNGRDGLYFGRTAQEYLKRLTGKRIDYKGEEGLTMEGWIILFLTILEKENAVIDEECYKEKVCMLIGEYDNRNGYPVQARWNKDKIVISHSLKDLRHDRNWTRFVVRIGRLEKGGFK